MTEREKVCEWRFHKAESNVDEVLNKIAELKEG